MAKTTAKKTTVRKKRNILTPTAVRRIRRAHATGRYTQGALSLKYGTTPANISLIVNGQTWKDVT